jgi:hypothetical protein
LFLNGIIGYIKLSQVQEHNFEKEDEFKKLYEEARVVHYTVCKPWEDDKCVYLTKSGRDWMALRDKVYRDTDMSTCGSP